MSLAQLTEFTVNHWYLFVALAAILALLIQNLIVGGRGSVDPLEATSLINRQDALVIDVRPAVDFHAGHILDAMNIPMNGFKNQLATLNKYRSRPIVVNCRSGAQSALACGILRKAGFEQVFNLRGGIMAWEAASLPLSRRKR